MKEKLSQRVDKHDFGGLFSIATANHAGEIKV
jgi:hypothetical protein